MTASASGRHIPGGYVSDKELSKKCEPKKVGASGGASGATTNVGGRKATDHMTGCNVFSCGRRNSSSDGRGCSCAAHSSSSGRNGSKSNTSDSRTETEAKEFSVLKPDRQPRGTARQQDARTSCARPMDSSASQLEKEASHTPPRKKIMKVTNIASPPSARRPQRPLVGPTP